MKPVTFLIAGAGGRGFGYANMALKAPKLAKVVAVAEPREFHREKMTREHNLPPERVFRDWKEAAVQPRMADAVAICTLDASHEAAAVAFAKKGYHILLEKPLAPTAKGCLHIAREVRKNGNIFAVCHVLRYTPYTLTVKKLVDSGLIGEVVSVQHLEPVGYWHQVHSFVRGNTRNEKQSSFMLLAKSCHDIDWLSYIIGKRCVRVSSFGTLFFFNAAHKPEGAADRCMECPLSKKCAYSAKEFYFRLLREKRLGWPLNMVDPTTTRSGLDKALREGPYGRCVFACDNDVVDNQIVNIEYEGGVTASFTMSAFNPGSGRQTRIFGTKGYLETADSTVIRHFDYLSRKWKEIDTSRIHTMSGGHGGGDGGLFEAFCQAIRDNDPSKVTTGIDESLESHLIIFAAEKSRRTGKTVEMAHFKP